MSYPARGAKKSEGAATEARQRRRTCFLLRPFLHSRLHQLPTVGARPQSKSSPHSILNSIRQNCKLFLLIISHLRADYLSLSRPNSSSIRTFTPANQRIPTWNDLHPFFSLNSHKQRAVDCLFVRSARYPPIYLFPPHRRSHRSIDRSRATVYSDTPERAFHTTTRSILLPSHYIPDDYVH